MGPSSAGSQTCQRHLWGPGSDRPLHRQCPSPGTGSTLAEGFAERTPYQTTALPHALRMAAPPLGSAGP